MVRPVMQPDVWSANVSVNRIPAVPFFGWNFNGFKTGLYFQALSQSDVEKMLITGAASTDIGVRMNIVNIAGNIAMLHINKTVQPTTEAQTAQLTPIIQFLLEAAARDVDLRVVAESLDKIIDIFTEDETDQFCVQVT